MRSSRLVKFRTKNKKVIFMAQMLIIWYAIIFSISLLTSNTAAYFSDASKVNSSISTASDWWDMSDLVFTGHGTQVIHSCSPPEISVEIKNIGLSMTKPVEYEIYYSEKNGNPVKHGKKIESFNGLVSPLEAGETQILTYETDKDGWYVFKAFQRPGFEGNYEVRQELWSEKLKVQCKDAEIEKEDLDEEESQEIIELETNLEDEIKNEVEEIEAPEERNDNIEDVSGDIQLNDKKKQTDVKQVEGNDKSQKEDDKQREENNKSVKEEDKQVEETDKSVKEDDKQAEEIDKSVKEDVKQVEDNDKTVKADGKAVKENKEEIK